MRSTKTGGFAKTVDTTAQWLITVSGVAVIAAMIAMLVLVVREAAPLFAPAGYSTSGMLELPPDVEADSVLGLGLEKGRRPVNC